ncbi:hypothetical protein FBEOM_1781 [Fusarium beomiforme]|uniref:Clr5 domain-containing protein n=1 Tax=Fusarium beomiforme TaxID=44412 RepID=A0A9P5ATL7_9HYPO|nr:hypothetical protein FBEOM_1781 [Fusarium beomiforme]
MDPLINSQPVLTIPSSEDWSRLRPLIKELYHDRRFSMAEVRDHLRLLGYWVNTRMIRARISQWNLQRNNQFHGMVAALRLLDPDPTLWPVPEPWFLIRGRHVALNEVLRYFRRKGIQNPIQWCRSAAVHQDEPTVSMLQEGNSPVEGPSEGSLTLAALSSASSVALSMSPVNIPTPIYTLEQKAAASLTDYCAVYLSHDLHPEPEVHQFTTHGRFGDRIQEGLAQMLRGGPGAFPHFNQAFALVRPLLSDCHPMGLAQLLAIVCELSACSVQDVLACLLRYLAAMASSLRTSSSLVQFLQSLSLLPPALLQCTAISSLRAALAVFSEKSPCAWHRLYIEERLCDCLYHGRDRTEGGARRAHLWSEQESFYGPFARNVVWTVTNVADDRLDGGDLEGAEACYSTALARAEQLSGFSRAKLRFAALEGLGRIEQMRFETTHIGRDACILHLQKASRYVDEALNEALIWFEPTSRRIGRVREKQEYISNLLRGTS